MCQRFHLHRTSPGKRAWTHRTAVAACHPELWRVMLSAVAASRELAMGGLGRHTRDSACDGRFARARCVPVGACLSGNPQHGMSLRLSLLLARIGCHAFGNTVRPRVETRRGADVQLTAFDVVLPVLGLVVGCPSSFSTRRMSVGSGRRSRIGWRATCRPGVGP